MTRAWDGLTSRSFERRSGSERQPAAQPPHLLWADPVGPLTIERVESNGASVVRLRHEDMICVDVPESGDIRILCSADTPANTIDHFIADQVIPRLLSHDGRMVVHAAAVQIGSGVILLLGPSGRGKSTLGASFDRAGYPLLGDDAAMIEASGERPLARSMYPSLRLLPDSFDALLARDTPSSEVAHYSDKRLVELSANRQPSDAFPIVGVFRLEEPRDGDVELRRLGKADACMSLVSNSFALDPTDTRRLAAKLAEASGVATAVPFHALSYPRDYGRLAAVREAVVAAVEGCKE